MHLRVHSASAPDKPAMIVVETGETVSFSQLARRSFQGAWAPGKCRSRRRPFHPRASLPSSARAAREPMRQHEAVELLVLRLALSPFFIDIHAAN
jgi:hypothetical protein